MKRDQRFVRLLLLFAACCVLAGCEADTEIEKIKAVMEPSRSIAISVCWPEDAPFGSEMRRIVNNYNLGVPKDERAQLSFSGGEQQYLKELRVMAATGSLPDVMIVLENPNDAFLQNSSRLMDLTPYQGELAVEAGDGLVANGALKGVLLSGSTVSLRIRREFLPSDAKAGDASGLLDAVLKENPPPEGQALELDVDEFVDSGRAMDFFSMLLPPDPAAVRRESLEAALGRWKESAFLFGDRVNEGGILSIFSSAGSGDTGGDGRVDPGILRAGYDCYLAACAQPSKAREQQVVQFLKYLLSAGKGFAPRAQEEQLMNRSLSAKALDEAEEMLRRFGKGLISLNECADGMYPVLKGGGAA
jgi:hypothetical protein